MNPKNNFCKLTDAIVKEATLPSSGDYILRDTEHRTIGLGVRIYASGSKSWIVQKKFLFKPKRVVLGSFPQMTLRKAIDRATIVAGQLRSGFDPDNEIRKQKRLTEQEIAREALTIEVAYKDYEAKASKKCRPATIRDLKLAREVLLVGKLWKMPLLEVKPADLQNEYNRLKGLAKSKAATNGGATRAGGIFRWLRAAFRDALLTREIEVTNPFHKFNKIVPGWYRVSARDSLVARAPGDLKKWWAAVEKLRKSPHQQAADSPTIADYLILSLLFGGRRTEMLTLKWEDVDFNARTIHFKKTVTKNKREHTTPYGTYAGDILLRRFRDNENRKEKSEYVFNASRSSWTKKGNPQRTHIKEPKKAIDRVAKIAGKDFSSHDLRRTFATLFEELGVSAMTVGRALNHMPKGTADRNYVKQRDPALRKLYQRLEEKILVEAGISTGDIMIIDPAEMAAFRDFKKWQAHLSESNDESEDLPKPAAKAKRLVANSRGR